MAGPVLHQAVPPAFPVLAGASAVPVSAHLAVRAKYPVADRDSQWASGLGFQLATAAWVPSVAVAYLAALDLPQVLRLQVALPTVVLLLRLQKPPGVRRSLLVEQQARPDESGSALVEPVSQQLAHLVAQELEPSEQSLGQQEPQPVAVGQPQVRAQWALPQAQGVEPVPSVTQVWRV